MRWRCVPTVGHPQSEDQDGRQSHTFEPPPGTRDPVSLLDHGSHGRLITSGAPGGQRSEHSIIHAVMVTQSLVAVDEVIARGSNTGILFSGEKGGAEL
ncbi:hypothetical protein NHX12_002955 [Muraenolepis orangiensis]|uniref:Uncharacterized protein n=1 Tax=Muraenolepis orangiensis TaxID=630683 RepID=A0A9Q0DX44_9TELE|nr:hypothetical protein NHX12_002955 [Muraenolepis orangiensis]